MTFWRVHKLAVTGSTNDEVKAAAERSEAEGYVVWALSQNAGRGRHGRVWESPVGNLYCSILLRPPMHKLNSGEYSFMTAVMVADTVKRFLPNAVVTLKWPNDVLVAGKKIGGILLEAGVDWLVIGIGLNVLHSPQTERYATTSLYEAGAGQVGLTFLLDYLLERLFVWYDILRKEGFGPIRAAWLDQAQKGSMTVRLAHTTVDGEYIDVDLRGQLRLRLADGSERSIATGDVSLASRSS
jgi:BirA family biotin operon repressor/biotin-[acetyl-CoA-carboxylase] ligase